MSLTTRAAIGLRTKLLSPYTPGDGQMLLLAGADGIWAGASVSTPGYLLAVHPHCEDVRSVYTCTGSSGDVLTGVACIEGHDLFFPAGSTVWLCTDTGSGGSSYLLPAFTAFGISGQTTPIEVGATVASGSKTFTWSTSNSGNVAANSISIVDTTAAATLASGLANDGTEAITISAITNNVPASQVWTINGTNTHFGTFSRGYTVLWEWRVYAGSSTNLTLTANQVKALSDSAALQASFPGSYSINPTLAYSYFCYPDSMGNVAHFIDGTTGFPISMADSTDDPAYSNTALGWSYATVSVTNAQSITTLYRVYRTQFSFTASPLLMVVS